MPDRYEVHRKPLRSGGGRAVYEIREILTGRVIVIRASWLSASDLCRFMNEDAKKELPDAP